jgi:hypothetical protein
MLRRPYCLYPLGSNIVDNNIDHRHQNLYSDENYHNKLKILLCKLASNIILIEPILTMSMPQLLLQHLQQIRYNF